ncbi:hypothetical protein [Streptomyces sp. SM11]|uniref:hypothetical protein n=1 Tax=Streptomyces sp. SM11 TaxID=565557 RepID=UPI000CD5431C|nr:hypothetical protein [Streptomyces sp. SM11]
MGTDLTLGSYGNQPERRPRPTKQQRDLVRRAEQDRDALLYEAKKQEFTAALRLRLTEGALHDVTDVVSLARQLSAGDPYLTQELSKLVSDFTRETARDLRSFGNGLGL